MTLNYATIKTLAKERGLTIKDLVALAPNNDPFYTGRDSELTAARWFAELWDRFGYDTGVHLRRIHYRMVTQKTPILRPDGTPYGNTDKDWSYLNGAGKWARYLGLVSPAAFVDRRNPEATINARWSHPDSWDYEDPTPGYEVTDQWDAYGYDLPDLPDLEDLPYNLPDRPRFDVTGYDSIEQFYHIEVWCEKTTMNDVLEPVCSRYRSNFVTGAGEMSITAVVEFLQRVRTAQRPARLLYISDYDPAGMGMPISVARKIEFFQRNEGFDDLDIRLRPVVLTAAQVANYDLPRIPVKDSDKRKANWEAAHGRGQVELDALEALYPGTLADIVTEAIKQYFDPTLPRRARRRKEALRDALEAGRSEIIARYNPELEALNGEYGTLYADFDLTRDAFGELIKDFTPQIETHREALEAILAEAEAVYSRLTADLEDFKVDTEAEAYRLPSPELPPEGDNQLYDSRRDYFDQLITYKAHRSNGG